MAAKKPQPEAAPATEPAETWNAAWSVRRRLLEARRRLKGTKLWEQFNAEHSFEAFSIHVLARGVEDILLDCGVLAIFSVTRWDKSSTHTVLEGVMRFESVDRVDVCEVPCVGEAINESDKGMAMATSHARKNGFIAGLNLSIGMDNERHNVKPPPEQTAGMRMGGSPQQSTAKPPPGQRTASAPPSGAANGSGVQTYTFCQPGQQARAVLGKDLVATAWVVISGCKTVTALDAFAASNEAEFGRFANDDQEKGAELNQLYAGRRKSLELAGQL